jgi:hypothetical protein
LLFSPSWLLDPVIREEKKSVIREMEMFAAKVSTIGDHTRTTTKVLQRMIREIQGGLLSFFFSFLLLVFINPKCYL